jgi:hypothetical protein
VQLFKLRYFQIKRDLSYWLIIIAIVTFYVSKSISETSLLHSLSLSAFILFLLFNYHINRKDLNFIIHYLKAPKLQICLNYNLLILPLSLAIATGIYCEYFFLIHLLVSLISFMELRIKFFKFDIITNYIPSAQFEWISGVRKNFASLCLLILLAIILSPVKLFGLAALFLLNSVFLSFYNFFEPLLMLNPENLSIDFFLRKKISFLISNILFINIPLLTINVIFNPEAIWFDLSFMFAFLLLAASTVYIKYANYKPNTSIKLSIDFLVLTISIFLIYLIPLSIYLFFSNKKKAITNLSYYLK